MWVQSQPSSKAPVKNRQELYVDWHIYLFRRSAVPQAMFIYPFHSTHALVPLDSLRIPEVFLHILFEPYNIPQKIHVWSIYVIYLSYLPTFSTKK